MNNGQFIERLQQPNWFVYCKTSQEVDLVLQACDDAGITWRTGDKATAFNPYILVPICIIYSKHDNYIIYDNGRYEKFYEEKGRENITDWFFEKLRK